ncbi:MAG TPA: ATP synthase F1 subunit gamma [Planctomycetota bacterium]|nr:ATP synthase F1 subunit gamma [Planctomycetota bacterium]
MAQGMKELRRRIRSVTSIQKITRAMEMVASTRLRRMQARAEGARPYADGLAGFSKLLAGAGANLVSPLTQERATVKRLALLVVTSDRGLCGAYNANLYRKVAAFLGEKRGIEPDLYVVGKKGRQHYARRLPVKVAYPDEVEKLDFRRAREIARQLTEEFLRGSEGGAAPKVAKKGEAKAAGVDEVWVAYTRFVSAGKQVVTVDRLLPIVSGAPAAHVAGTATANAGDAAKVAAPAPGMILLEPSPQELFDVLMPKSLAMRVFAALLDSMASEQAARRIAMKAATDAAGDMITSLSRKYNRARQETITKELLDIVGGAEALQ